MNWQPKTFAALMLRKKESRQHLCHYTNQRSSASRASLSNAFPNPRRLYSFYLTSLRLHGQGFLSALRKSLIRARAILMRR